MILCILQAELSAVFFLSYMDLGTAPSGRYVTVRLCRSKLPRGSPHGLPAPWRVPSCVGQLACWPALESLHSLSTQAPCTVPVKKVHTCCARSVPVLCGRHGGPRWFWRPCSFWPAWQPHRGSAHLGLLEWKRCVVFPTVCLVVLCRARVLPV